VAIKLGGGSGLSETPARHPPLSFLSLKGIHRKFTVMSILHVNQIARRVRETYEAFIPRDDLKETDSELEMKLQTRCLAAFAVQSIADCTIIDAAASVVDGTEDNGLDAVFYSEGQNCLVIVQSKWIKDGKSEPDSAEVGKFCRGVRDLINCEFDRFNDRLQRRRESVENALSTFNCQIVLVLIHTGKADLAHHAARQVHDLLAELNDASEIATFHRLGQERVYGMMAEGASGGAINLEFNLASWGKVEAPHSAFYGMVAGTEVASWWKQFGELLFVKNLRSTLGQTEVNRQILATVDERPDDFWYFNNGITVTAKSVEKTAAGAGNRDLGNFKAVGAHVVNGAQTVSSIGRFQGDVGNLEKVKIPLRIISLQEAADEYEALITRSNNTQNRIEARDFVSQDKEQQRLRLELQMEGIDYHIARSEGYRPSEKSFDLEEATIALACSLEDSSLAVLAKREIGRFWIDLDKAPYKKLFNPQTLAHQVFHAVLVQRIIEAKLAQAIQSLEKRSGKRYGVLVHGNRLLSSIVFARLRLSQKLADLKFTANTFDLAIEKEVAQAVEIITSELTQQFADSFPAVAFKNPTKSKVLFDVCLSAAMASQMTFTLSSTPIPASRSF
jgi:hypothetical protein